MMELKEGVFLDNRRVVCDVKTYQDETYVLTYNYIDDINSFYKIASVDADGCKLEKVTDKYLFGELVLFFTGMDKYVAGEENYE